MNKFWTNTSCATWGPNLQLMLVVLPCGQICASSSIWWPKCGNNGWCIIWWQHFLLANGRWHHLVAKFATNSSGPKSDWTYAVINWFTESKVWLTYTVVWEISQGYGPNYWVRCAMFSNKGATSKDHFEGKCLQSDNEPELSLPGLQSPHRRPKILSVPFTFLTEPLSNTLDNMILIGIEMKTTLLWDVANNRWSEYENVT